MGKPRKLWGLCRASVCGPNVATHKTGFCDFHHAEYALAKGRHNDLKYNFKAGRSSNPPPSWDDYLAAVTFTPLQEMSSGLDERVISILTGALDELERAKIMLGQLGSAASGSLDSIERVAGSIRSVVSNP